MGVGPIELILVLLVGAVSMLPIIASGVSYGWSMLVISATKDLPKMRWGPSRLIEGLVLRSSPLSIVADDLALKFAIM